jgi:hypothetical protein
LHIKTSSSTVKTAGILGWTSSHHLKPIGVSHRWRIGDERAAQIAANAMNGPER